MGLMGAVLCRGLCEVVCVGAFVVVVIVVVVAVLDDVDPVAECVFAGEQACAVVG